jgi:hypothetical protein
MQPVNNWLSEIMYKNNAEYGQTHNILVFMDMNEIYSKARIKRQMKNILQHNDILRKRVVLAHETQSAIDDKLYFQDIPYAEIKLKDNYKLLHTSCTTFDSYTHGLLNYNFGEKQKQLKWFFQFCVDKEKKCTRIYFIIDHVYADGYNIIEILKYMFETKSSPIINTSEKIQRKPQKWSHYIYYYTVGILLLIYMHIRMALLSVLCKEAFSSHKTNHHITDYLLCDSLDLRKLKAVCKEKAVTINDILFSLVLRTDYLYHQEQRVVNTLIPVYLPPAKNIKTVNTNTNNFVPVILSTTNNADKLLELVNSVMNNCKYSPFILFLKNVYVKIVQYISALTIKKAYTSCLEQIHYSFSNVIGPALPVDTKLTYLQFLSTVQSKEIVFHAISSHNQDCINIGLTFQRGLMKDEHRFKECFKEVAKAYLL